MQSFTALDIKVKPELMQSDCNAGYAYQAKKFKIGELASWEIRCVNVIQGC